MLWAAASATFNKVQPTLKFGRLLLLVALTKIKTQRASQSKAASFRMPQATLTATKVMQTTPPKLLGIARATTPWTAETAPTPWMVARATTRCLAAMATTR